MDAVLAANQGQIVRALNGLSAACGGLAVARRAAARGVHKAEEAGDDRLAERLAGLRDRLSRAGEGLARVIAHVPEECWAMWFEEPRSVGGHEVRARVNEDVREGLGIGGEG